MTKGAAPGEPGAARPNAVTASAVERFPPAPRVQPQEPRPVPQPDQRRPVPAQGPRALPQPEVALPPAQALTRGRCRP